MDPKRIAWLVAFSALFAACSQDTDLKAFKSDGCSLFPDSSLITEQDWCSCCFEHDLAYWQGGTREQREVADTRLKECVFEKTRNSALANLMYEGVRFGGSPYFLNWYRWGYGWSYDRKYQALTTEELESANAMIEDYYGSAREPACPG